MANGYDNYISVKVSNNVLAQYVIESSSKPIGISEYELSKLYPANFKGSLPGIADFEKRVCKERIVI